MKKSAAYKKEENPKAFKYWINKALLERMATALQHADPKFNRKAFVALAPELDPLELKPRVQKVRDHLQALLPSEYPKALRVLRKSLKANTLSGFDLWAYTEFVQTYGLEDPEISLQALYEFTQIFTSEFAVRPFLKEHPETTLQFLLKCSQDRSEHVRRWASEGTRPRLPWGERLQDFVRNPQPALPILENLKYDEALYVRKSVANHLNDIAKDHPELLVSLLGKWQKEAPEEHRAKITWITHRSLRTLIKAGHPGALRLIGADPAIKIEVRDLRLQKKNFQMSDVLEFEFALRSRAKKSQRLVVDYIIHHVKANQETSPKVFKLKSLTLVAGQNLLVRKKHALKPITTRKYYPGQHLLEIQVNGRVYAKVPWILKTQRGKSTT